MGSRGRLLSAGFFVFLAVCASFGQSSVLTLAYQLTHIDQSEPFFSPDGKKVVYEMTVAGHQQIFIMNANGTAPVQITNQPITHESPSWSPDGKLIAFVADDGKHEQICTINIDGSGEQCLTDPAHKYIHPNWSADSTKLIFCSDDYLQPPKKNE